MRSEIKFSLVKGVEAEGLRHKEIASASEESWCDVQIYRCRSSQTLLKIVLEPLAIGAQKLEDKSLVPKLTLQRYHGIMTLQCHKSSFGERSWSSLRQQLSFRWFQKVYGMWPWRQTRRVSIFLHTFVRSQPASSSHEYHQLMIRVSIRCSGLSSFHANNADDNHFPAMIFMFLGNAHKNDSVVPLGLALNVDFQEYVTMLVSA